MMSKKIIYQSKLFRIVQKLIIFLRSIEQLKNIDNRKTLGYMAFITKLLWGFKASTVNDDFHDLTYGTKYSRMDCLILGLI